MRPLLTRKGGSHFGGALLVRSAAYRCGRSALAKRWPASTFGRRAQQMEGRGAASAAGHCGACVVLGVGPASVSASAEGRLSLILLSTHCEHIWVEHLGWAPILQLANRVGLR